MKLTAYNIIEELYHSDPTYHVYTLEEFTEVCLMPLTFFKKKMKEKTLPTMRFKHMGQFTVFPGIIAKMLHYNKARLDKGIITKETFDLFNDEMEEVHKQLTSNTYQRGYVNFIYYDNEESSSQAFTG